MTTTTEVPTPEELYLAVVCLGDIPRHEIVARLAPFSIVEGTGTDEDKAALARLVTAFIREPTGTPANQVLQLARRIVGVFTPGGLPVPSLPSIDPGFAAELTGIYSRVAARKGYFIGPGGATQYETNVGLLLAYRDPSRPR